MDKLHQKLEWFIGLWKNSSQTIQNSLGKVDAIVITQYHNEVLVHNW